MTLLSPSLKPSTKSEDAFVARMNDTSHKLGMYATRFINPHGLPGEGQQTTARDMAILTEAIREAVSTVHVNVRN